MQLPTPLTIPWDSNLHELQNAYFKSPTPLLNYVGFAVEINWGCRKPRNGRLGSALAAAAAAELPQSRSSCVTDVTRNPELGSWCIRRILA